MPLLTVTGLHKSFPTQDDGHLQVICDLSFDVSEGEFVSFFGPNGCGKTTLLFLIAGTQRPDSGTIALQGAAVGHNRVGVVFQNYRDALLPWRNNLDNLCFPLELHGMPRSQRNKRGRELVRRLNLTFDLRSRPYQLSGGQQQLLSLARALVSDPALLLLDEPLSSLDFQTALRTREEIQNVWTRTKITTIFVSHDIEDAIYLSDRIYLLTQRPATIHSVIEVNLPRPRTPAITKTTEFFDIRNKALDLFKELTGV